MNIDAKKKVLFVIGMDQNPEIVTKEMSRLQGHNILILQSYGPDILPFGELMRDIIIAVYQDNVEEIIITVPKNYRNYSSETFKKIYENKELQGRIQTLEYLFKNCLSEYPKDNIKEWLEGSEESSNSMKNSAGVIRNHPLMPSNVKITELIIENEKQSKIAIQ
ncbi:MAG: hypothetical protein Q8934_01260 [Bacillota bacterium]|nr:hypothetical protein [Bacillota bacterium]